MNIWITKDIRFGYKYAQDKHTRKQIIESTHWLIQQIKDKGKSDDVLIISGGLFSNTNPSIIAINDARHFISQVKKVCDIILVNNSKDNRLFEGDYYSTLEIFDNTNIIKDISTIKNITIIPFGKTYKGNGIVLDSEVGLFNSTKIPNLMQLDENDDKPGVIVYNPDKIKHIIFENILSPKHETIIINNITELKNLISNKNKNNYIHLVLNKSLMYENRIDVDMAIFKINPISVKYKDEYLEDIKKDDIIIDFDKTLNIDETIYNHIGNNEDVKKQFERIKLILENKK